MLGKKSCGTFEKRNEQFDYINTKLKKFSTTKNPIISMDTKKIEYLGNIYKAGKTYCTKPIEVYDHTNNSLIEGVAIPHGIYDLNREEVYINIGKHHGTTRFVCDSIKQWWEKYGKIHYPQADEILIFCDAGGANSWRINVFKVELNKLCNELKIKITICHYPPYTSKWNPIEHRVFPHIARSLEGAVLRTHQQVKTLIESARRKGLEVKANITNKKYLLQPSVPKSALEDINIIYDGSVHGFNYSLVPIAT